MTYINNNDINNNINMSLVILLFCYIDLDFYFINI